MKEAARISASLLEENFNTVYYWAKGLSTPSQEIIDRAEEILLGLPTNQPSRKSILENFLQWVAQKYEKTRPRDIYNQASDLLGVSPATVARWIRENSMLKSSTVERMESLMGSKGPNDNLKKLSTPLHKHSLDGFNPAIISLTKHPPSKRHPRFFASRISLFGNGSVENQTPPLPCFCLWR